MTYAIQLPCGKVALIDQVDFDRVAEFRWSCNSAGYAQRTIGNTKQALHQFILAVPDGCEVDHRNGDRLDNRRENLRVATRSQNQRNVKKKRNSKHPYKGIAKNGPGWMAQLRWNGNRVHLGTYSTAEAAGRAYDKAAHCEDPEFAKLNFSDGIWTDEQLAEFRLVAPPPSTGYSGVQKNGSGWSARLKVKGKNMYFGTFQTKEEASAAVEAARIQYQ